MRSTAFCVAFLLGAAAQAAPSTSAVAAAQNLAESEAADTPEELARLDFENALRSWKRGFLGGLLFYYDGRGPLGLELRKSFDARNTDAAKPEEWEVPSFVCQSERECSATTMIRFSDEEIGGLRRYRLIRKPGQFWGLFSEEKLECPAGYRLQYQGLCVNSEDERSDDPEIVVRTADPVAAE